MMKELSLEEFTRFTIQTLEPLGEITLDYPDNTQPFPLALVTNPMQSIKLTEDNIPVLTRFSITIEWWTNKKYESMKLFEETNKLLRQYNFLMVGNAIDIYDDNTKKHRFGGRYEVNYNGLTNSFERIK